MGYIGIRPYEGYGFQAAYSVLYYRDRRWFNWFWTKEQDEKESLIPQIMLTSCLRVRFKCNNWTVQNIERSGTSLNLPLIKKL